MESSPRKQSQEVRISPTVSEEKLVVHATRKLSHGYVLIIGTERRNANFFKPGKGFEPFKYKTAQKLVKEGIIQEQGEHYLGRVYMLSEQKPLPKPKPVARFDDDDDFEEEEGTPIDSLLDTIDEGEMAESEEEED